MHCPGVYDSLLKKKDIKIHPTKCQVKKGFSANIIFTGRNIQKFVEDNYSIYTRGPITDAAYL